MWIKKQENEILIHNWALEITVAIIWINKYIPGEKQSQMNINSRSVVQ